MDSLFGSIQISSSIQIKRSDGRIHLAKVVQLSPESKSVGVEWNENGEVKGKEILLDLVLELNGELQQTNKSLKQSAVRTIPSSGLPSKRLTLDIDSLEREYDSRPPPTLPPQLFPRGQQQHAGSLQTPTTGTVHAKATGATLATTNPVTLRSVRRPTVEASSPLAPSTPVIEQATQALASVSTKSDRRLSRPCTAQYVSPSINPPSAVIPTPFEPPPTVDLHGPFGQMIFDYRSTLNYRPLTNVDTNQHRIEAKDLRICVAVRKRMLNKREQSKKDNDVVTIPNRNHCLVHVPKSKVDLTKFLDNQTFK